MITLLQFLLKNQTMYIIEKKGLECIILQSKACLNLGENELF